MSLLSEEEMTDLMYGDTETYTGDPWQNEIQSISEKNQKGLHD